MEYLFSPTHANIHNALPVTKWDYDPVPVHAPLTIPERTRPLLTTLGALLVGVTIVGATMLALAGGLIVFSALSAYFS